MSRMIDTANIRAGARNFNAAAQELHGNAKRMDQIYQNLSSGQNGWKGEGAEAFQMVNNQMWDDCNAAASAFERTSSVLNTLAGMSIRLTTSQFPCDLVYRLRGRDL